MTSNRDPNAVWSYVVRLSASWDSDENNAELFGPFDRLVDARKWAEKHRSDVVNAEAHAVQVPRNDC